MQRIRVVTAGNVKTPWVKEGIAVYTTRLSHVCNLETIVVAPGNIEEEGKRMLKILSKEEGVIIALDERGKMQSSTDLAAWIAREKDAGRSLCFVIGGAYGLSENVKKKAHHLLSLSALTFPHELCQLFLFEQLFRSHAIFARTGYHH